MLLEEEPNRQIEVLNTRTASGGLALLLHEAIHSKRQDLRELFTYLKEKNESDNTLLFSHSRERCQRRKIGSRQRSDCQDFKH